MIFNLGVDKMILIVEGGLMLLINFVVFIGNLLMCFILYKKFCFYIIVNIFILLLIICYVFIFCLVMFFIVGLLVVGEWMFG